ncbi:PRD domain-containing protein [Oceanotoga sp. DSM 15011]|jgi:transcriptional regulatory protein LevR|uniref:PRD domain-containing protein n=1 Tax=Oceanotoga sp. DSM 15011 TaxID=2984951 RepID=UPI0021F40C43|nr:PRD domain-containing protein [Oceanotoga sp. DSM 15011]UYO99030.1 PRD domain-containing protein [Oceanotoga sp. DSM 15011]
MELKDRLNILKESGQLDQKTFEEINQIIKSIFDDYKIELNEENGAMLITHLSIALTRIKKDEKIDSADDFIIEQIKADKYFEESLNIIKKIENIIKLEIPENEKFFIQMHLCVLLNNELK